MPPVRAGMPRSESAFHKNLTPADRLEILKLQTLRELPKARYATQLALTELPAGRGRKVIFSHVEVYKMVETIATSLREAGVRPGTVCAFVLENSVEAIVYFLALQWIGAIASPIDPTASADETITHLKSVKAATVVSPLIDEDDEDDNALFQKMRDVCNSVDVISWHIHRTMNEGVVLEMHGKRASEGAAWSGGAGDFKLEPTESSIRMANVEGLDTSLTVQLNHRNMASATRAFSDSYELSPSQSTLLLTPVHSIQGLICMLGAMYSGGHIVISGNLDLEPEDVFKIVKEEKVSWFSTDADRIMELFEKAKIDPEAAKGMNLSFVRSVGGNIDADTLRQVEPVLRAPILEAYGVLETSGVIVANKEFDFRPGTCGKPVTGCAVAIFNDDGEKLTAGTSGNIGVAGPHVASGYMDNIYANEKSLVSVTDDDGQSITYFLTGDEGSLDSDGFLTVATNGKIRRGASAFRAQEEEEIKSSRALEAAALSRAAQEERETKEAQEEAARRTAAAEAEEMARKEAQEEEERRALEARTLEDKKQQSEERKTRAMPVFAPIPVPASNLDSNVLDQILDRLDAIERNQKRMEEELEARRQSDMIEMRALVEKTQQQMDEQQQKMNASNGGVIQVNMDEINSAVNAAAASAQSSSQNTAAAAQAAKDAAAAAERASVAQGNRDLTIVSGPSNFVEVNDPSSLQKTVLVSLDDVEEAMKLHPAVETARAFGRPDAKFGNEVFCAIVPGKGARISEPWLKLHAQSVLPAAFVPKKFFFRENLSPDSDRAELAQDKELKRISHLSGYSTTKLVKRPTWNAQTAPSEAAV